MAASPNGSVYATGWFVGPVDFDPGAGIDEHVSNGESNNVFVTSYDLDGAYRWTRTFGGDDSNSASAIASGPDGVVFVVGSFHQTADFDPGPGLDLRTSNGGYDIFMAGFSSEGDYLEAPMISAFGHRDAAGPLLRRTPGC